MVVAEIVTFEEMLVRSATFMLAGGLLWLVLVAVAILAEGLSSGRIRCALALGCPPSCHRWLLAALGAALAAVALTPSTALAQRPATGALDGLQLPDRPIGGPDQHARARNPTGVVVSELVTVAAGQSLWEISRARLPSTATPQRISSLSRTIYDRNRPVIGKSADLIHPGQRLAVPPTARTTYSEDS